MFEISRRCIGMQPQLSVTAAAQLQGYQAVYARLGVRLEERGESFYNPMLPGLVQMLMDQSIAEESEGAKVVFVKVSPAFLRTVQAKLRRWLVLSSVIVQNAILLPSCNRELGRHSHLLHDLNWSSTFR